MSDEEDVWMDEPTGSDLPDASLPAPAPTFGGCGTCGWPGGECMTPGPSCGIAQSLKAQRETTPAPVSNTTQVEQPKAAPDEGGVWVTYYSQDDGLTSAVSVHPDELSALRVAVEFGHSAALLKWGEVLL